MPVISTTSQVSLEKQKFLNLKAAPELQKTESRLGEQTVVLVGDRQLRSVVSKDQGFLNCSRSCCPLGAWSEADKFACNNN